MSLSIKKIQDKEDHLIVMAQGCLDDCLESTIWKGKTDGNTKGCYIYENVYTPATTSWW